MVQNPVAATPITVVLLRVLTWLWTFGRSGRIKVKLRMLKGYVTGKTLPDQTDEGWQLRHLFCHKRWTVLGMAPHGGWFLFPTLIPLLPLTPFLPVFLSEKKSLSLLFLSDRFLVGDFLIPRLPPSMILYLTVIRSGCGWWNWAKFAQTIC